MGEERNNICKKGCPVDHRHRFQYCTYQGQIIFLLVEYFLLESAMAKVALTMPKLLRVLQSRLIICLQLFLALVKGKVFRVINLYRKIFLACKIRKHLDQNIIANIYTQNIMLLTLHNCENEQTEQSNVELWLLCNYQGKFPLRKVI